MKSIHKVYEGYFLPWGKYTVIIEDHIMPINNIIKTFDTETEANIFYNLQKSLIK